MKRTVLYFIFFAFFINISFADPIDSALAKKIAINFYYQNSELKSLADINAKLAYVSKINDNLKTINSIVTYYVFSINNNGGFVIVTADNDVLPILGYTLKGSYSLTNQPPAFIEWMKNYEEQILYVKQHKLKSDKKIQDEWHSLQTSASIDNSLKLKKGKGVVVAPLIQTTWNQGSCGGGYNDLCPYDYSSGCKCVTGCVATTMAQIMKYWNYPVTGTGNHSYNSGQYGILSANFSSHTYNWSNMPLYTSNADVALLMYDCGVSVEMSYDPNVSIAYTINYGDPNYPCAQNAYSKYFGYNPLTIQGLQRGNYTDADWENLLKNDLNSGRPVQYAGTGSQGGHTWVCDGYDTNDNFHMNWGWSGNYNGYYNLNSLYPTNADFNYYQKAIIGIQPLHYHISTGLQLYTSITVKPNPINFEDSITVNADITNKGTTTFTGDIAASLFDSSGVFITYIGILEKTSLPPNYHWNGGIFFKIPGILAVPGNNYIIGIYYDSTGTDSNWKLVDEGIYTNPITVAIKSPVNNITLYSKITSTPTTLIQGELATIKVNFVNNGTDKFYGVYLAALWDLSGNYVQTINYYIETNGLASKYAYTSPIPFSVNAINVLPGTYVLGLIDSTKNKNGWNFIGGTSLYFNPIKINVVPQPLTADKYEPNNTEAQAYKLSVNYSGNTADVNTTGSNIDKNDSIDYYKIDLESSYKYSITVRVYDKHNESNGKTYTMDVLFTYKDTLDWSDVYDDSKPVNFTVNNGGTVYFEVIPANKGETGTYLLDIKITRTKITYVDNLIKDDNNILIYPIPTKNYLHIEFSNINMNKIILFNSLGELLYQKEALNTKSLNIDLSGYANGIYYLEAINNDRIYYKKFIVSR